MFGMNILPRGSYPAKKMITYASMWARAKRKPVSMESEAMWRMLADYERNAAILN